MDFYIEIQQDFHMESNISITSYQIIKLWTSHTLQESIKALFWTGLMTMVWWNTLGNRRRKVEILFKGPLNNANDPVKCNYVIYWSGEIGMELVDKWEIEGNIHDGNRNQIDRYFELFEEHITPKSNA